MDMRLLLVLALAICGLNQDIRSIDAKNALRDHALEINRIERTRVDAIEQSKKKLLEQLNKAKDASTKAGDLEDALSIQKIIADVENPPQTPSTDKLVEQKDATIRSLEERIEALSNTPGSKRQPGINGTWRWFDGSDVTVTKSGDARQANGLKGVWRPIEGRKDGFKIAWSNGSIDTLSLSNDGIELNGTSVNGIRVWAVKITN